MPGPSLPDAIHAYLDHLHDQGLAAGTIRQYRGVLLKLSCSFRDRQLAGLKTVDLSRYLYGRGGVLVGRSASRQTVVRAALRGLWAYAELMGWCRAVNVPRPVVRARRAASAPPTRLTRDELLLMLKRAGNPEMRCMLAVAMNTALRISDVRKIRMPEVDLSAGSIMVWSQKTQRYGEWPITADLDAELRQYLTWYGRPLTADVYLFPGWTRANLPLPVPERPVSFQWAYTRISEVFAASGVHVEKGEAWHAIRRSVARIYFDDLRAEVSHDHALRQTMALLDHMNVSTTEKYLGMQAEIRARDESLRGKPFILRPSNVIPMESRRAE